MVNNRDEELRRAQEEARRTGGVVTVDRETQGYKVISQDEAARIQANEPVYQYPGTPGAQERGNEAPVIPSLENDKYKAGDKYDLAKFVRENPGMEGALKEAGFKPEDIDWAKQFNRETRGTDAPDFVKAKDFQKEYFKEKGWEYKGNINDTNWKSGADLEQYRTRIDEANKAHDEKFRPSVSQDAFIESYFEDKGWGAPSLNRNKATAAELSENAVRLNKATDAYIKKYGVNAVIQTGGSKIGAVVVGPAMRAVAPEVVIKDISGSEWAWTGAQAALIVDGFTVKIASRVLSKVGNKLVSSFADDVPEEAERVIKALQDQGAPGAPVSFKETRQAINAFGTKLVDAAETQRTIDALDNALQTAQEYRPRVTGKARETIDDFIKSAKAELNAKEDALAAIKADIPKAKYAAQDAARDYTNKLVSAGTGGDPGIEAAKWNTRRVPQDITDYWESYVKEVYNPRPSDIEAIRKQLASAEAQLRRVNAVRSPVKYETLQSKVGDLQGKLVVAYDSNTNKLISELAQERTRARLLASQLDNITGNSKTAYRLKKELAGELVRTRYKLKAIELDIREAAKHSPKPEWLKETGGARTTVRPKLPTKTTGGGSGKVSQTSRTFITAAAVVPGATMGKTSIGDEDAKGAPLTDTPARRVVKVDPHLETAAPVKEPDIKPEVKPKTSPAFPPEPLPYSPGIEIIPILKPYELPDHIQREVVKAVQESKTKAEMESKVKAVLENKVSTSGMNNIIDKIEAAPIGKPSPSSQTITNPSSQPLPGSQPGTSTETVTSTTTDKPKKPLIPYQKFKKMNDKQKRKVLQGLSGAVAFRQGELHNKPVHVVVFYPYTQESHYVYLGKPPENVKLATGPKSAYKTVTRLFGKRPSKRLSIDIGVVDAFISPSGKHNVAISFKQGLNTKSDMTISKHRQIPRGKAFPLNKRG